MKKFLKHISTPVIEGYSFNEILYEKLWASRKKTFIKFLYCFIPFLLMLFFYAILGATNSFQIEFGVGFLQDYTNLYIATMFFLLMYFVCGKFPNYTRNIINSLDTKEKMDSKFRKRYKTVKMIFTILSFIIGLLSTIFFIFSANSTHEVTYWYDQVGTFGLIYYGFILFIVWFMSLKFFLDVTVDSIYFYCLLNTNQIKMDIYNRDNSCGLKNYFTMFSANIGFGLVYLLGAAIIFLSDYIAENEFKIINAFSNLNIRIIMISVIITLTAIYYIIALLPMFDLRKKATKAIMEEWKNINITISKKEKEERLREINPSVFNKTNFSVFISTFISPTISLLLTLLKI